MVDFQLPPTSFHTYECDGNFRLGLNILETKRILSRMKGANPLAITLNGSKLDFAFATLALEKNFSLALLDLGETDYPPPKMNVPVTMRMTSAAYSEILKDAAIIDDYLVVAADQKKQTVIFRSSNEAKEFSVALDEHNEAIIEFTVKESARSAYSLYYLAFFDQPKLAELIRISFSADMPLLIEYPVLTGKLCYYLSPRIVT